MAGQGVDVAIAEWLNEVTSMEAIRLRPVEPVAVQLGGEGEPDVLGQRSRTVAVALDLLPDEDPMALVGLLSSAVEGDPQLSDEQGDRRVLWAGALRHDKPEKTGLGPRVMIYLSVTPLHS